MFFMPKQVGVTTYASSTYSQTGELGEGGGWEGGQRDRETPRINTCIGAHRSLP